MRVAVASLMQETNTFSPLETNLADFQSQGLYMGTEIVRVLEGTNTEICGAIERLDRRGVEPVPLIRAWAMSSGRLSRRTLDELTSRLERSISESMPLDGLVLSLHGAMAAQGVDSADGHLLRAARSLLGDSVPIGVCLDLHANVTNALIQNCNVLVGYHTYPHVDQAITGARIADIVVDVLHGRVVPITKHTKRHMLLAPERHTIDGPMGELWAEAGRLSSDTDVLDVSLFPVQPWLDVEELGFASVVTTNGDPKKAEQLAERIADLAWQSRDHFAPDLVLPQKALEAVRESHARPWLLAEAADSPTAGTPADSPAMIAAMLEHGRDLRGYVTLVDSRAVAHCISRGINHTVEIDVGCEYEQRFHRPVGIDGVVKNLGMGEFKLTGPVWSGMPVSMGRFAVVEVGRLSVLITERPAFTIDPETFRVAGMPPEQADVIVVRSAGLFRPGWAAISQNVLILDLPGASTSRFEYLTFNRAPRPLYPIDDGPVRS